MIDLLTGNKQKIDEQNANMPEAMRAVLNPTFEQEYELAYATAKRRFGSECKHEVTRNGKCVNCFRKVVTK